jgi:hypothetical protein
MQFTAQGFTTSNMSLYATTALQYEASAAALPEGAERNKALQDAEYFWRLDNRLKIPLAAAALLEMASVVCTRPIEQAPRLEKRKDSGESSTEERPVLKRENRDREFSTGFFRKIA